MDGKELKLYLFLKFYLSFFLYKFKDRSEKYIFLLKNIFCSHYNFVEFWENFDKLIGPSLQIDTSSPTKQKKLFMCFSFLFPYRYFFLSIVQIFRVLQISKEDVQSTENVTCRWRFNIRSLPLSTRNKIISQCAIDISVRKTFFW